VIFLLYKIFILIKYEQQPKKLYLFFDFFITLNLWILYGQIRKADRPSTLAVILPVWPSKSCWIKVVGNVEGIRWSFELADYDGISNTLGLCQAFRKLRMAHCDSKILKNRQKPAFDGYMKDFCVLQLHALYFRFMPCTSNLNSVPIGRLLIFLIHYVPSAQYRKRCVVLHKKNHCTT